MPEEDLPGVGQVQVRWPYMPGRLLKRDIWTKQLSTPEQQKCSFLRFHFLQIDALSQAPGALPPCCEHDMPPAARRQVVSDEVEILDVIQDEQPVWLIFEPTLDGSYCLALVLFILLWQLQHARQVHKVACQHLCASPPWPTTLPDNCPGDYRHTRWPFVSCRCRQAH